MWEMQMSDRRGFETSGADRYMTFTPRNSRWVTIAGADLGADDTVAKGTITAIRHTQIDTATW
jgi:hypothetical protein